MRIITMNESLGIIWYSARDYKLDTIHVVIYGLQRSEFLSRHEAQTYFDDCLTHAFECNGE